MFAELLSESQKASIAAVAIAHVEVEVEVERCIIELCGVSWLHGAVLIEKTSFERKLEIFKQLLEIEFHETAVPLALRQVDASLRDLNAQRNTVIHGQWTVRSLVSFEQTKPRRPGQLMRDIERKDIVAYRKKMGKQPPPISAKHIAKVAGLLVLNRRLLHQLFWEHFNERIRGLSGLPEKPDVTSTQLAEKVLQLAQKK